MGLVRSRRESFHCARGSSFFFGEIYLSLMLGGFTGSSQLIRDPPGVKRGFMLSVGGGCVGLVG